jgi:hypothetical protein
MVRRKVNTIAKEEQDLEGSVQAERVGTIQIINVLR